MSYSFTINNKIPGTNSNKQKTLPEALIVLIGWVLFKSHILIVLSYEPVATFPESNSIIWEIESLWDLNDLMQVKFVKLLIRLVLSFMTDAHDYLIKIDSEKNNKGGFFCPCF